MNKTWSAPGKADVLGDTTRKDVQQANQTAEQMSKLLRLLRLRNVYFQMEQPSSSFFFDHPDVKKALEDLAPVTRYYIYMGAWGHDMMKACIFMSDTHTHTLTWDLKLFNQVDSPWCQFGLVLLGLWQPCRIKSKVDCHVEELCGWFAVFALQVTFHFHEPSIPSVAILSLNGFRIQSA